MYEERTYRIGAAEWVASVRFVALGWMQKTIGGGKLRRGELCCLKLDVWSGRRSRVLLTKSSGAEGVAGRLAEDPALSLSEDDVVRSALDAVDVCPSEVLSVKPVWYGSGPEASLNYVEVRVLVDACGEGG